jgi:tetratricopeptide (TPR) repeat protein
MAKQPIEVEEISPIEKLKVKVQHDPTEISHHLRPGWMYYGEGSFEEAVRTFQYAEERFPSDVEVRYALGLSLKKSGREQGALEAFHEVIRLADSLENQTCGVMLRRLAAGHANILERGDWDLRNETWERK